MEKAKVDAGPTRNHHTLNGLTDSVRPVNRAIHRASTRIHFLPHTVLMLLISLLHLPMHAAQAEQPPPPVGPAVASSEAQIIFREWDLQSHQTCQPIPEKSGCRVMPYNATTTPNLVGQYDSREAEQSLDSYSLLVKNGCSPHLKFFLCATYFPMCTTVPPVDTVIIIPPCRALCLAVQEKCLPVMQEFGYPWPSALDCDKFPEANRKDQMCMPGPIENVRQSSPKPRSSRPPPTSPAPPAPPDSLVCHPHSAFIRLNASRACAFDCDANFITTEEDKLTTDILHGVVASFAILLGGAVFGVLCCAAVRLGPLEKPVGWVVVCTMVMSTGYLVRLIGGRFLMGCTMDEEHGRAYVIVDGVLEVKGCIAVFILLYYFGMAASLWWLVMTLAFWMSSGKDGKVRENPGYMKVAHPAVWLTSAAPTVTALVGKYVDADELSATCSVGQQNPQALLWLHLFPLCLITLLGIVALTRGAILRRQHALSDTKSMKTTSSDTGTCSLSSKRPSRRHHQLSDHFLLPKCAVFFPSAVIVIILYSVEYFHRDTWTAPGVHGLPVVYYLTRVLMQYAFGITLSIWTIMAALTPRVCGTVVKKPLPNQAVLPPHYANVPPFPHVPDMKGDFTRVTLYESSFHPSSNDYASVNMRVPAPTEVSYPPSVSTAYHSVGHLHNNKLAAQQQNLFATQDMGRKSMVSSTLKDGRHDFV
ncbi:frizzled-4-like [Paramacrobiotus metropolitanus]|uniref:frizzled-4-like n=1 Tax=Paramacrobiotus metropolitanus TaxID=2943436 RepID=UPI00244564C3|nr:frizzled-4-like [Paramacrobiotus metropolitanus]